MKYYEEGDVSKLICWNRKWETEKKFVKFALIKLLTGKIYRIDAYVYVIYVIPLVLMTKNVTKNNVDY